MPPCAPLLAESLYVYYAGLLNTSYSTHSSLYTCIHTYCAAGVCNCANDVVSKRGFNRLLSFYHKLNVYVLPDLDVSGFVLVHK